jgi:hypothetical protein
MTNHGNTHNPKKNLLVSEKAVWSPEFDTHESLCLQATLQSRRGLPCLQGQMGNTLQYRVRLMPRDCLFWRNQGPNPLVLRSARRLDYHTLPGSTTPQHSVDLVELPCEELEGGIHG